MDNLEPLSAFERLAQLRGLESVTERLERLIEQHFIQSTPAKGIHLHIALTGNPGTGKSKC